jgi:hypothetical protein
MAEPPSPTVSTTSTLADRAQQKKEKLHSRLGRPPAVPLGSGCMPDRMLHSGYEMRSTSCALGPALVLKMRKFILAYCVDEGDNPMTGSIFSLLFRMVFYEVP